MASRVMAGTTMAGLVLILALSLGCGLKAPPEPRSKLAPRATVLAVRSVSEGMALTFNVPLSQEPRSKIRQVRLYYGYFPLVEKEECPPCALRLAESRDIDLQTAPSLQKGAVVTYLDREVPNNVLAGYQVVLIDGAGRSSQRSNTAKAVRVTPAAAPAQVQVLSGDRKVELSWSKVTTLDDGKAARDIAGYRVTRRGPKGTKVLNLRPLKTPNLVDKTVENGVVYFYQVQAVRRTSVGDAPGVATAWKQANPRDLVPPKAISDLVAVRQGGQVYLRWAPSPDQDITGYYILRSDGLAGAFKRLNALPVKENVYVDKGVSARAVYRYKVIPVDNAGNLGPASEALTVR